MLYPRREITSTPVMISGMELVVQKKASTKYAKLLIHCSGRAFLESV
jgi:hypothetical protein